MTAIEMLLCGYGVYLVYLYNKMKNTNEIPKGLISNKINLNRAKDIPGFIKYIYPRGMAFAIILTVASFILILDDFYPINYLITLVTELLYFAVIIYFAVISIKAQNKYLL